MDRNLESVAKATLFFCFALVVALGVARTFPGQDWHIFYTTGQRFLAGENPYGNGYYNAPWLLVIMTPLLILSEKTSYTLIVLGTLMTGYLLPKNKLAVLLSYPLLFSLYYGQIDLLILWGMAMPPWLGLFFLLAKPQVGIGIAIYMIATKEIKAFVPVTIAFLISFGIYGLWIDAPVSAEWNASFWPQSLPIALVVLAKAIKERQRKLSIAASPLLAPYAGPQSFIATILFDDPWIAWAVCIGIWGVRLLTGFAL